jgi:DNA-binding MarR family transcriptional regulator
LTNDVNGEPPVLPLLFELAIRQMRVGLAELSDTRFPGLRTRHYRLLGFIPDGGIRLTRVAALSGLTKQALGQALVPLEAGGYVTVGPDPDDRRARLVRRSERGREVLDALRALQQRFEQDWSGRVGPRRWAETRSVLTELFAP